MRRFLLTLLCCWMLMTAAFGADLASGIQSAATINPDGSCQVTLIAAIHLDKGKEDLHFPLPEKARSAKINNKRAGIHRSGDGAGVSLDRITGGNSGDFTVTISYTLDNVISLEKEIGRVMQLPLLSGFEYPVDRLDFTVTLPGTFPSKPTFSSGYYQESIESSIIYVINGSSISGYVKERLQDHETLSMRLVVPDELFTQAVTSVHEERPYLVIMSVIAGLATVYWVLAMRSLPLSRVRCAAPPEGITAGELGSRLVHQGADLTLMVLSWAQLGYLMITMDETGRIFLHKRMNMGNERSAFENHYFRSIFQRRNTVDGTSYRYARLCQKASGEVPRAKGDFSGKSGNPRIFRLLCGALGAVAGTALGSALSSSFAWRVVLAVLMTPACGIGAWLIQDSMKCLHIKNRQAAVAGGLAAGLWLIFGIASGTVGITLWGLGTQVLGGLACAYGGRRSELGKQTAGEILGLRHYLRTVSREEVTRILATNPDFYYEMAPYALALGVDKAFAAAFGKMRQPHCSYLITGMETDRTALEWYPLLRDAADGLNARRKRLKFERFTR